MDHWYAECVPCKWEETYTTQDSAIAAAETHVRTTHSDLFSLNGIERSRKMVDQRIGHVQLRSEDTLGYGVSAGAASLAESGVELSLDAQITRADQEVNDALERLALLQQKQLADTKAGA